PGCPLWRRGEAELRRCFPVVAVVGEAADHKAWPPGASGQFHPVGERSDEPLCSRHVLAEDGEAERGEGVCAGCSAPGFAYPFPHWFGDTPRFGARTRAHKPRPPAAAGEVLDRPRPFVIDAAGRRTELDPAAERRGDFLEAPRPDRVTFTRLD